MLDKCYRSLGYTFRIQCHLPEIGRLLEALLAPFATDPVPDAPTYLLTRSQGGWPELRFPGGGQPSLTSAVQALDFLFSEINRMTVERLDGRFLAVHASAASFQGKGLVFPAPPDSGKTTLVAGLTVAGFDYLSEEMALFDREGLLHPFPRPLTMSGESMATIPGLTERLPRRIRAHRGPRWHVRPDDLRHGAIGTSCRLRYVVRPRYSAGGTTKLRPISRAEGVLTLFDNAMNFSSFGGDGLRLVAQALTDAECYELQIGDLESAVEIISELFDRPGKVGRPSSQDRAGLAPRGQQTESHPHPQGEFVSIRERMVVSPAWGRVHEEALEEGRRVEGGSVLGLIRERGLVSPIMSPQRAVFVRWLVRDGERVAPGSPLALLLSVDGEE